MHDALSWGDAGWGDELAGGLAITLQLAALTLPVGLMLGFAVASASLSRFRALRVLGIGYTTVLRGLPEILTLFVVYNAGGALLNRLPRWVPGAEGADFSPLAAGIVALGAVFGAYAAEVLRGAFDALDPGQTEAGLAVGMSRGLILRRIELPQLWRFALPGMGNLWINLLKDTSLVSVIALGDLMRVTKVAVGTTRLSFGFYLVACLIYWAMSLVSEFGLAAMERRAARGIRGSTT